MFPGEPDARDYALMVEPGWWTSCRFGLFVHSNIATVPAWSPIGQYADWYRCHLGDPVADVLLHPSPLVEVLAHHRDRWSHIEDFYEFLPLLTYDRFDADEWTQLALEAGMSYTVFVTKHHDGLCWWDAPGGSRSVIDAGPRRNVLSEYAAACERAGLVFGTYYSLLDWDHPQYRSDRYVSEVLHPQVIDLIERYGSRILWGDGHWGHGPEYWRTEELLERARSMAPDLVVNDRWWAREADIATFEYQVPDTVPAGPWELCRGIGHSFCHNRNERPEHHLDDRGIVVLLTEVVAKGGNLLLNIGPAADGSIPSEQAEPLRSAGAWIRRHREIIDRARPWRLAGTDRWGDRETRLVDIGVPGEVIAIDHGGRGLFADVDPELVAVAGVESLDGVVVDVEHDRAGLRIRRHDRSPIGLGALYRITYRERGESAPELFSSEPPTPIPLAPLVDDVPPGTVVRLGEGTYLGPAHLGPGVVLRGLGPQRTIIDGAGNCALTLAAEARVEHLGIRNTGERVAWFPVAAIRVEGDGASILGTTVRGHVIVTGSGVRLRGCDLDGVVATGASALAISRSQLSGMRWDTGIEIDGGAGHLIEGCELVGHLCAVRLGETVGATVRGNAISARWWGVHLRDCEDAHIVGNSISTTMRAVDVDGGTEVLVDANAVADGDSGCIVERGAVGVTVRGNHWSRCRIGLLAWDAGDVAVHDNVTVGLHDAAVTIGP